MKNVFHRFERFLSKLRNQRRIKGQNATVTALILILLNIYFAFMRLKQAT